MRNVGGSEERIAVLRRTSCRDILGPLRSDLTMLIGEPAWHVEPWSVDGFRIFFGRPHWLLTEHSGFMRPDESFVLPGRSLQVVGEWNFLSGSCTWLAATAAQRRAVSGTSDYLLQRAVFSELQGQVLIDIDIDERSRRTTLEFDLGGAIQLDAPDGQRRSDDAGIWHLDLITGGFLSFMRDGSLTRDPSIKRPGRAWPV